uniref:hypothetical protein n=1 Tax=Xanthomonas sp. 0924 TaxID=2835534 RepID=UPI003F7FBE69
MVVHQYVSIQLAACGVQGLMYQMQIAQSIAIIKKAWQALFPGCTMCCGTQASSMRANPAVAQDLQPDIGANVHGASQELTP